VADGEVGEVVVTTLNPDYPLIRFGTGDLSAVLPGECPTGRTNVRIRGWLGRADDAVKVRGMFVHPGQVADIVRRHAAVVRARLVVGGEMASDVLTLEVECDAAAPRDADFAARIAQSVRDITKLRAEVRVCAAGEIGADARLIEDRRRYD
jgi:phenylacetate-CoA ligase